MQIVPVFSFFLSLLILGGSLTLYISFQSILALYLLIMQVITRVLVPSATFPNVGDIFLCNWHIIWQNALYLYLGKSK